MLQLIYTILCIICLCMGFIYGYKIGRNEKIEKPIEKMKEIVTKFKEQKEEKRIAQEQTDEMKKFNNILQNIDRYDGTARNQKEV